ncbi:class I SAM-dependent methyltransferase [Dactylosporangium sp. AC04546]|uniref:class I SAM-dependent methyltransferase n=1 Tax=Dactylosporangium sp. AC04546 TaxID=2862460 RepID=UPI001EDDEF60|nr:class I SAM-dependent methyltransferase [Dactylosporangium sp. AC04546]WVK80303.1 class I SAM-dependent methyltransferase [Dactylosporangium sp. AC04546]
MTEAPFLRATRDAYDALSAGHLDVVASDLRRLPVDRALLGVFAEWVRETGNPAVLDAGCGPGRVTGALHDLGLDASGVDLSPAMVAIAARAWPDLRFTVGSLLELPVPDGTLGGVLANYSIIHVPWEQRPAVLAEFRRVLAPGGYVMLAFQVGDDRRRYDGIDELTFSLDFYRQRTEDLARLLDEAGFEERLRAERQATPPHESLPQGYVLARRR